MKKACMFQCRRGQSQLNSDDLELALSSGGSAAVLAGVGTVAACELAGITKWRRLFGVSGGAIVTALLACGMKSSQLLRVALEHDFDKLISFGGGLMSPIFACFGASVPQPSHPDWTESRFTGLYGSAGLGQIIENYASSFGLDKQWPENFSTLATTKNGSPVVFNKDGVFLIDKRSGKETVLSNSPAPLGLAVRASATIPGVIAALRYKGIHLFDGALTEDGFCPVGINIRRFGARPDHVLACRVGEPSLKPMMGRFYRWARRIWFISPHFNWGDETTGVMEVHPQIDHVHTLKFRLTQDEKWYGIMVSFEACLNRLAFAGLLHSDRLTAARELMAKVGFWRDRNPSQCKKKPQPLADSASRVFKEYGLL